MADDILYFVLSLLFYGSLTALLQRVGNYTIDDVARVSGSAELVWFRIGGGSLPLLLQCAILLLASDLLQYGLHRCFHGRLLWPFHAVHHSSRQVSWLSSFRVHPVNQFAANGAIGLVAAVFGFSPIVFVVLTPIRIVHALVVHANLDWTFGPLRYVIASPVFHRWHHASDRAARNRNMAPTFPFIDLLFGTFYFPQGALPQEFGCDEVPDHFVGQLLHPAVVGLRTILPERHPPAELA